MPDGGRWAKPAGFSHQIWIPEGADYDPTLPDHFVGFCEAFLRFPDGHKAGLPVVWSDWQRDLIIRPTWGLRWKRNGRRVVKTRFFLSARGTAKSSLAAAESVWAPVGLGLPNVNVFLYAVSIPQASVVFEIVENLVVGSAALDETHTVHRHSKRVEYACDDVRGAVSVRSGDAKSELGRNPDISYLDELLAQKNPELYTAIKTGYGKKPEGLFAMMTTPDLTVQSFAREEYNYAKQVMDDRALDASYLPVVFEAGKDDDPFDRKTWIKAAPNLGDFMDEEVYEQEARRAVDNPIAMHSFKVFRLALWADAGTGFINMESWRDNVAELPSAEELAVLPCVFGLDTSTAHDMTSLCMLWNDEPNECVWALWRHWSTSKMVPELNDMTFGRWNQWRKDPDVDLRIGSGNWIDVAEVAGEVEALAGRFKPIWVGVDSFRSSEIQHFLGEDGAGLPLQTLHSGAKQMQGAVEHVEGLVRAGRLKHNGDPVAEWAAQCTQVTIGVDALPRIHKMDDNRRLRIDPIAALCMAADRLLAVDRGELPEEIVRIWLPDGWDADDEEVEEGQLEELVVTR